MQDLGIVRINRKTGFVDCLSLIEATGAVMRERRLEQALAIYQV